MCSVYTHIFPISLIFLRFFVDKFAFLVYNILYEYVWERGKMQLKQEYELIKHNIIKTFKIFLVELDYRTSHIHKDFEICFVLSGTVNVLSRELHTVAQKNDFFVLNPFQPHELNATGHSVILSIQIPADFCKEYYPEICNTEFDFCTGSSVMPKEQTNELLLLSVSLARNYFLMDNAFELICTSDVNEILYRLIVSFPNTIIDENEQKRNRARYERTRRIIQYIDDHYTERLFLSEIAERENLSLTYLSHFFKDCFQMSFQDYLQSVRCEKARQILLSTDLNMLEICLECGFSDIKYLNKEFNKHYGFSPKEYRRRCSREDHSHSSSSVHNIQKFFTRNESLEYLTGFLL